MSSCYNGVGHTSSDPTGGGAYVLTLYGSRTYVFCYKHVVGGVGHVSSDPIWE